MSGGGTSYAAAFEKLLELFKGDEDPSVRKCVVFLSDGGCSGYDESFGKLISSYPSGMQFHTVGFGNENLDGLRALAEKGKGKFFSIRFGFKQIDRSIYPNFKNIH